MDSTNGSTESDVLLKLDLEDARRTIDDQKLLLTRVTAEKDDTQSHLMLLQQQVNVHVSWLSIGIIVVYI